MATHGKLTVDVDGNATGFEQALRASKASAAKFSSEVRESWSPASFIKRGIAGLGAAASFEGVKSMIEGIIDKAVGIREVSEQFDISTDSVQRWEKALNRAGIQTTTFYRSLDQLRQKRALARGGDEKEGEAFTNVGLYSQAVGGEMSDEDLMHAVLKSGASRAQLKKLGVNPRLQAAEAKFDANGQPAMGSDDIRTIEESEGWVKANLNSLRAEAYRSQRQQFGWVRLLAGLVSKNPLHLVEALTPASGGAEDAERAKGQREEAHEADMERQMAEGERVAKETAEAKAKQTEAQERLREAKRKNMTPGLRKQDMAAELKEMDERIKTYSDVEGALSPADAAKLAWLRTKREGLFGEMRQMNRPVEFEADAMAKSGLDVGGNFVDVQQQVVDRLTSIDAKVQQMSTAWNFGGV